MSEQRNAFQLRFKPNIGAPIIWGPRRVMEFFYITQGFMEAPPWDELSEDFQKGFTALSALIRAQATAPRSTPADPMASFDFANLPADDSQLSASQLRTIAQHYESVSLARMYALQFAHGALRDHVKHSGGLEKETATAVMRIIVEAVELGTFDKQLCPDEFEQQEIKQ